MNAKKKSLSFAIGFWCFSCMFFEDLCKIVDIHDAAVLGNGLDLQFCCGQKVFCHGDSSLINKFYQSCTGFFVEQGGQIAGT